MSSFDSPEEARATIAAGVAAAKERAATMARVGARITGIRVEEWSRGREVKVVVDGSGLLVDLEFAETAPDRSPLSVSRAVLEAHERALTQLQEEINEIASSELEDPATRENLVATYRTAIEPHLSHLEDSADGR